MTEQLTLFKLEKFTNYDSSQEPPDPDEYPTIAAYESAWAAWERKYPQLVQFVKGMSDDISSSPPVKSPQSRVPNPHSPTPGDWVKLAADWMNHCAATSGNFKKDYEFSCDADLICKVIWVDSRNGNIYVSRGGDKAIYVTSGNYQLAPQHDTYNQVTTTTISASVAPLVGEQVTSATQKLAPQHDTYNQVTTTTISASVIPLVGGKVTSVTQKVAPQHDATHWVEKYWVERSGNKYWYYRYMWMSGRKLQRLYIGAVHSPKAQRKKQAAEDAIADGQTPEEIKQILRGCK